MQTAIKTVFAAVAKLPRRMGGGYRAFDDTTFVWLGPTFDSANEAAETAVIMAEKRHAPLDLCRMVRPCPPQLLV